MICPQTKAECQYGCDWLMMRQCSAPPPVAGRTLAADCAPTRGHAMLADIERLVDAYGDSCDAVLLFEGLKHTKDKLTAKAALMAAIRLYGRE